MSATPDGRAITYEGKQLVPSTYEQRGDKFRYNLVHAHYLPDSTEAEKDFKDKELERTSDWWGHPDIMNLFRPIIQRDIFDVWLDRRLAFERLIRRELDSFGFILYYGFKMSVRINISETMQKYYDTMFFSLFEGADEEKLINHNSRMEVLFKKFKKMIDNDLGMLQTHPAYFHSPLNPDTNFGEFYLECIAKLYYFSKLAIPNVGSESNQRRRYEHRTAFRRLLRDYIRNELANDDFYILPATQTRSAEHGFHSRFGDDHRMDRAMYRWAVLWYNDEIMDAFGPGCPDILEYLSEGQWQTPA